MDYKQSIKIIKLAFVVAYIIISFALMLPDANQDEFMVRSKSLSQVKTTGEETERIDYVNENGKITIAADVGYATVIATIENGSRLEHFYDEEGEPIQRYSGYYGILREYDDEGRNYHIQYLDVDDSPVITGYGYSDKYLTFYDTGKIKTEKYFDPNGNPICSAAYGYGLLNEYDEQGNLIKITYLNKQDKPMKVGLGYAMVTRNIYKTEGQENGKIESEFYFDETGEPVALSLGQFGVHKEYDENGQASVLTYLDHDGRPMVTNKGYTTVTKTYYANNHKASERYFDLYGKPYALADGQYGLKINRDMVIFLDQEGREEFNVKRLLYNEPLFIILFSLIAVIISGLVNRKWNYGLLFLYVFVILYMTLMFRDNEGAKTPEFLWHYRKLLTDSEARDDILKNIWLFIPLGAILFNVYPRTFILLVPVAFSIIIEGIQYISGIGFCELDDILSNSIGGWIGFYIGKLTSNISIRINSWKHIHNM